MNGRMKINKLNRYTTIPFLLDMLHRGKLFMPGYDTWEDQNDVKVMKYFANQMKKERSIDSIRALCFSWDDETIHHWKYFADGSAGCCIEFDGEKFLSSLQKFGDSILHGAVTYRTLQELKREVPLILNHIPFVKRHSYRIESEYRIIHLGKSKEPVELSVSPDMINRITFNQKIPIQTMESIMDLMSKHRIKKINHSTVFENKKFIRLVTGKKATDA